jgi:hypothetical protein
MSVMPRITLKLILYLKRLKRDASGGEDVALDLFTGGEGGEEEGGGSGERGIVVMLIALRWLLRIRACSSSLIVPSRNNLLAFSSMTDMSPLLKELFEEGILCAIFSVLLEELSEVSVLAVAVVPSVCSGFNGEMTEDSTPLCVSSSPLPTTDTDADPETALSSVISTKGLLSHDSFRTVPVSLVSVVEFPVGVGMGVGVGVGVGLELEEKVGE